MIYCLCGMSPCKGWDEQPKIITKWNAVLTDKIISEFPHFLITPRLIFDIYSITFLNLSLYLYIQFPGNKFTWICQKWVFLKLLLTAARSNWTHSQLGYDVILFLLPLKTGFDFKAFKAFMITVKIHVDWVEFFKWGIPPLMLPFIHLAHL